MFNSRSKSLMCFVRSVISYPLCASPCPLLLWGVFSGRICLLLFFFLSAMEFVPLWFHCHRPNASRWSCREPDGRTLAESIGFWNQTNARPLEEMRFYAFSQCERENDFGSHCLPTPSSPQPLPKFLLLSIMFNYWQTRKQPSIVQARFFALLIQWVLSWIVGNTDGYRSVVGTDFAAWGLVFHFQIFAHMLNMYIKWYVL